MVENPRVLDPAGLERLVLSRGLLTCCKGDILSCWLDSPTQQVGEFIPRGLEPLAQLCFDSHQWGVGANLLM